MNDLVVIGVDAVFADQSSIDRFDRCIYNGEPIVARHQVAEISSSEAVIASANKILLANDIDVASVTVFVMGSMSANDKELLLEKYPSVQFADTFAAAMKVAYASVTDARAVIIVAVNASWQNSFPAQKGDMSFNSAFEGYVSVQGVAAVLLANIAFAKAHQSYIYAYIKGFSDFNDVATACAQALNDSSFTVDDVKYIEVSALASAGKIQQEMNGIIKGYNTDKKLATAVGCLRSVTGEGLAFSQLAGFIKAVIVTYQRYFPGTSSWQLPASDVWNDSPFYFPVESRPWFPNANGKPLVAAYSCLTEADYCHIILHENQAEKNRDNGFMACSELVLLPITSSDESEMHMLLEGIEKRLNHIVSLPDMAREFYEVFLRSKKQYTLALLAESVDELRKEIALAKEGITAAFSTLHEWKTPKGSFFTAEPVGHKQNVTFMYPGIGATYIGLARDIFHLFPAIYQPVAELADDIAASLKDTILNPRTLSRPGFNEMKQMDHELRAHLPNIAECGVGFACVFTKIFENVFKIKADFSAGYSMGEISMYAALGCWKKPGDMSARLAKSDTFNHRLTGRLDTLRQHWGLPDAKPGDNEKLWETYTLKATPEEVAEACEDEDRVYCTIINTPDSLVIGGYPEACERVIKKLGVRGMALDIQNAIHSEPAFKEYESMEALYTMEVQGRLDTKIYSSSCYLPVPQRSKAIANSIAKCLCDPVDFPRLINTVYDKGARVFIEMGPGRSLCSWVDKILKHDEIKPHVSVPVNAKGVSDELTIIRAVAKLLSHGVEMDLSSIYYGSLVKTINKQRA